MNMEEHDFAEEDSVARIFAVDDSEQLDELELLLLDWQELGPNGTSELSMQSTQRLREILRTSEAARSRFVQLQMLDAALTLHHDAGVSEPAGVNTSTILHDFGVGVSAPSINWTRWGSLIAASVLALAMGGWLIRSNRLERPDVTNLTALSDFSARDTADEATSQGVAILTRLVDVTWTQNTSNDVETQIVDAHSSDVGRALRPGVVAIDSGLAQIEFFCGATVVLEGPAELELLSSHAARFRNGCLRAQVPPAARGFTIDVGDMQIVDLGTEFGVSVSANGADVQVFDGEVELHRPDEDQHRLTAGNAIVRGTDGDLSESSLDPEQFVNIADLESRAQEQTNSRYERWVAYSTQLRADPRLIAYYAFDVSDPWHRRLTSNLLPTNSELDGAIVGARQVEGRWPAKGALEFKQPGDRVRVNIPGEYGSLTLACWVRIDSLDRWYNSLFLTDSYQQGEPHWQILDTGQLFFSIRVREGDEGQEHREVLSPPFWNPSLSGKWLHLATTYDVEQQTVTHYLNGQQLSVEAIPNVQLVKTTRFGAASIGNWTTPTKPDEHFAIRNLNGSMDELAVFSAALSSSEISEMYENGRP